jgi:DNA adenine methylase
MAERSAVGRPALRYHGGKWKLAPWILGFFPRHRVYVEPFGGAGSVLIRKAKSYAEVYNDLDSNVVTVFRVLRDPVKAAELRRRIELTPFARDEFKASYTPPQDEIDQARKTIARAFMGFGSASTNPTHLTGFRATSHRSHTTPAMDWANWPAEIPAFVDRLREVIIENRNAAEVILQHDSATTLIYADPPYVHSTRYDKVRRASPAHCYTTEMTDADHVALAEVLRAAEGMVVLSGYPCSLYDVDLYPDWVRHERQSMADGARPRTEVVWLNPACAAALAGQQSQLRLIA